MPVEEWQLLQTVALASLLAWASGFRLYLVIFAVLCVLGLLVTCVAI